MRGLILRSLCVFCTNLKTIVVSQFVVITCHVVGLSNIKCFFYLDHLWIYMV